MTDEAPTLAPFSERAEPYLRLGWPVFPTHTVIFRTDQRTGEILYRCTCGWAECPRPGKHPRIAKKDGGRGQLDATTDPEQIEIWGELYPLSNMAVATGKVSGLAVIDIDGAEGEASIQTLLRSNYVLPKTVEAMSGSGGRHLYYRYVGGIKSSASKIAPKVDIRADGGQCTLPPSMHKSGNPYRWINPPGGPVPLAMLPLWVPRRIAEVEAQKQGQVYDEAAANRPKRRERPPIERIIDRARIVATLSPDCGHRNHTLNREAFIAFRIANEAHIPDSEVEHHMLSAARACGLHPSEAKPTIMSARRSARSKPSTSQYRPYNR